MPARPPRSGSSTTLGALKVVLAYAGFASLWILLSDELVASLVKDPAQMTAVSILKGSVFVAITSLLLFVLVRRFGARLAERERALRRQQAEKERTSVALEASETLFATAFQFIPVALSISRLRDGRIITVNDAFLQLFGATPAEVAGRTSLELGLWGPPNRRAEVLETLTLGETVLNRELPLFRMDGAPILAAYSGRLVDMQGERCLLAVAVDLTESARAAEERRRLEAEIQHAQKLESLGSLASGVAHDMNNVLAAIQTMVEVLSQRLAADPVTVANLDTINRASRRGRDLVKGLTHFARKDLREPETLDLNAIVREEAELLDRTLLQKTRVVLDLEAGLPAVWGEAGSLGSALMNLCVNAVDAMPQGGTLTLQTRSQPPWVELRVADTGTGMAPAVLARATEPFFTTKAMGKGTGLGLAMVHGTLKAHGGTLLIQSEVGQGSTLTLRLPALAGQPAARPQAAGAAPMAARPLRVLLVDDDELIRTTLPPMLELAGHHLQTAAGGREALALLEGGLAVDLVVLDLNMPDMNGLETLARLRILRPGLPVLVATGYLDAATADFLQGQPRILTLGKPYSGTELAGRMRELCP